VRYVNRIFFSVGAAGILARMSNPPPLTAEQWRQIIDAQRPSGLTVAAYCRDRGIKDSAFYAWKRRLRSPVKPSRLSKPAFVEVKPLKTSAVEAIEVCLRGERRLLARRGFDRELLIELIRALESIA
jgi:transposase-like protein